MRRPLVGAAALVLAGCGAGTSASRHGSAGAPVLPDAPAPAIVSVSEPAPDWLQHLLQPEPSPAGSVASQGTAQFCFAFGSSDGSSSSDCSGTPTPEQRARFEAQQKAWREAVALEPGSTPRVVATLPLAGDGTASFTAWTAAGGTPCWATDVEFGGGGGGGGPAGPCSRLPSAEGAALLAPCDALCLDSSAGGSSEESETYALAGTVPADADALRVTLAGGAATTYPLSGPLFPGVADRRIFLLELGDRDWRTLELVRGGAVVRTVAMPKMQAAIEDCRAQIGPPPKPAGWTGAPPTQPELQQLFGPYETKLNACLDAAGALPRAGSTTP